MQLGLPIAGGHPTHGGRHQKVRAEIPIGGRCQLEHVKADIFQGLFVDAVGLIGVLHQLMYRQRGIVGLHHFRHLG